MKTLLLLLAIAIGHASLRGDEKSAVFIKVHAGEFLGGTDDGNDSLYIALNKNGTGICCLTPVSYDIMTAYSFRWKEGGPGQGPCIVTNIRALSKLDPKVKSLEIDWNGERIVVVEKGVDWSRKAILFSKELHGKAWLRLEKLASKLNAGKK